MKFSEQWLREWVNPDATTDELVAQLTMAGLEVDAIEPVAAKFTGVVVGQVLSTEPHPDADKLTVCKVTDGAEEFQVVCGAKNVREGLKIPFAKVGAVLAGDSEKDFKIKKAKLRGVESLGMLCAASELGLADSSDGLMELISEAPVGEDFRSYLKLDDVCIEVDLTPNRGDCLSVKGIARETGVLYQTAVNEPVIDAVEPVIDDVFPVGLEATAGCPRYVGRVVRGVNVKAPTPLWMQERLRRSGVRSIDIIVNVTNYILLELGQPMHAFDLNKLQGGIQVRMAEPQEKLTLLDGQEVALSNDTLVIADANGPLAMAGIMGGEASGVTESTQDIFLESAFFAPLAVAGKARSYGLHTDSSHRFERGVDYQLQRDAIERATALITELAGGKPGPVIEEESADDLPQVAEVKLRAERVEQVLGLSIDSGLVTDMLNRMGLDLVSATEDGDNSIWVVKVPSFRFDISIEVDLIEELARIYGYDKLPVATPTGSMAPKETTETRISLPKLRRHLVSLGYQEAITYSFVEPKLLKILDPDVEPLALANPISADMSVMRSTLWAGLIKVLEYNQNRQQSRIRLFETGLRFVPQGDELQQEKMLAGVVAGTRHTKGWAHSSENIDFYDIKGDLESILAIDGKEDSFQFSPVGDHPTLHPGQSAKITRGEDFVGYVGALHPQVMTELGLQGPVFLFELVLDKVLEAKVPEFSELSKFPEVHRDLAVIVDQEINAEQLLEDVREKAGDCLTDLTLFDVYQGKGIDTHRKSIALGLTLQHASRTLKDEEVNETVDRIVTSLKDQFNATLRE